MFGVDSMVIPTDAKNVALAHEWINYMLDPAVALKNTEFVGYTTPVQSVYDEVTAAGGTFEGIEAYTPRLDNTLDESFRHNEELKKTLSHVMDKDQSRLKINGSRKGCWSYDQCSLYNYHTCVIQKERMVAE